jgi:hypothetical protein
MQRHWRIVVEHGPSQAPRGAPVSVRVYPCAHVCTLIDAPVCRKVAMEDESSSA